MKLRLIIALACLTLWAAPALAQSKGRVLRNGTTIWKLEVNLVAAIAGEGTILDLTARSDRWYEVVVPATLGGRGEHGRVAIGALQLLEGSPEPPVGQIRGGVPDEGDEAQPYLTPVPPGGFKAFVVLDGGYQATKTEFVNGATVKTDLEDRRFDATSSVKAGPVVNVAVGAIARQLGFGVGITRFSRSTPTTLTGSIPHPFFFNQPRTVTGNVDGLKREELAVHVQVRGILPVGARCQVMLFGGPSFFRVKQDNVTDFTYTQSYPYDQAQFSSAQTDKVNKSAAGFNAGGDVAFFFARQIGVGVSATFSRAEVDAPAAAGGKIKAGGVQIGAGLRIRF